MKSKLLSTLAFCLGGPVIGTGIACRETGKVIVKGGEILTEAGEATEAYGRRIKADYESRAADAAADEAADAAREQMLAAAVKVDELSTQLNEIGERSAAVTAALTAELEAAQADLMQKTAEAQSLRRPVVDADAPAPAQMGVVVTA